MKPMAIDPTHRIDIDEKGVIDQRHRLDEPVLIVQSPVRYPQMDHVRQIKSAHKPRNQQIAEADNHSPIRPERFRRQGCRYQELQRKCCKAQHVIYFH